jgi:hypothetical protein
MSKSTTGAAGRASRRVILLNSVSTAAGGFIPSAPAARTALAQTHPKKRPEMLDLHSVCDPGLLQNRGRPDQS